MQHLGNTTDTIEVNGSFSANVLTNTYINWTQQIKLKLIIICSSGSQYTYSHHYLHKSSSVSHKMLWNGGKSSSQLTKMMNYLSRYFAGILRNLSEPN